MSHGMTRKLPALTSNTRLGGNSGGCFKLHWMNHLLTDFGIRNQNELTSTLVPDFFVLVLADVSIAEELAGVAADLELLLHVGFGC